MRFRPANISLINRRHYLPRLRLTLSSNFQNKNNLTHVQPLTGHTISIDGWAVTRPERTGREGGEYRKLLID